MQENKRPCWFIQIQRKQNTSNACFEKMTSLLPTLKRLQRQRAGKQMPKYFLNEKAHRWSWCRDEGYGRVPSIKIERCHYQKKSSVWRYTGSEKMMLADGGSIRNWEAWAWGPFVLNPFGFRDVWWMPNINIPFKQMDLAAVPDTAPNMAFMELCWVFSISLFCVLLETLQTVHKRIQIWRYQGYTNQAAMVVER